jgi:hypothetical protein
MGAGNNRPQGSLLPQYRPSMLTKNPSNVKTYHHSCPVISWNQSTALMGQGSNNILRWYNDRCLSFLIPTISDPATNTLCKYHRSNHMVNYDTFTNGFHRTEIVVFNQSLLISTPVRSWYKEQCYLIILILLGINIHICCSSISLSWR